MKKFKDFITAYILGILTVIVDAYIGFEPKFLSLYCIGTIIFTTIIIVPIMIDIYTKELGIIMYSVVTIFMILSAPIWLLPILIYSKFVNN